ncbi:unnamed protein product [Ranitomeya imitator]|uniref:Reverse transcriptase domain-containing protein n=1 Tax=Ranitomeya imitator TaxID=111125 RepID=A0ABN9LIQ3_9NEOB|nr:unnamed protein product [Ranitomeya imitator]
MDLDKLETWAERWQMRFNNDKCKVITMGRGNQYHHYTLNGKPLGKSDREKDLGILVNDKLTWSSQCQAAAAKANRIMGCIKRGLDTHDESIILPLYKSLENLKRLRDSITRRRNENKIGKSTDLDITKPIRRGQNVEVKHDIGTYDSTSALLLAKREIKRGNWKTDSTSSTASSASNRSSTRSIQSMSSGMEGDNEDTEPSEYTQRYRSRHSLPEETPPPRPPRIPNSTRSHSTSGYRNVPKVPPRNRN